MLVLSRKQEESLVITGGITITVLKISPSIVRLGIKAPDNVQVLRGELVERQQQEQEPGQQAQPKAQPQNRKEKDSDAAA